MVFGTAAALSVTLFFFFNDTATTEIYTLSLHDALPISLVHPLCDSRGSTLMAITLTPRFSNSPLTRAMYPSSVVQTDRKSTRLNSSHVRISYAVFCLKKNPLSLLHSTLTVLFTHCKTIA